MYKNTLFDDLIIQIFFYRSLYIYNYNNVGASPWGFHPQTPADADGGCRGRMQMVDALGGPPPHPGWMHLGGPPPHPPGWMHSVLKRPPPPPSASALCVRPLCPPSASALCVRLTLNGGRGGFPPISLLKPFFYGVDITG